MYFHYSKSRAGAVAKELLGDFSGYVHTDACAGYGTLFIQQDLSLLLELVAQIEFLVSNRTFRAGSIHGECVFESQEIFPYTLQLLD
jgi:hypothetical protein